MRTGNLQPARNIYAPQEVPNESPNITISGTIIRISGTGGIDYILGGIHGQFITLIQTQVGTSALEEGGNIRVFDGVAISFYSGDTRCFYYDAGFDLWLDIGSVGPLGQTGDVGGGGDAGVDGGIGSGGAPGDNGQDGPVGDVGDPGIPGNTGDNGSVGGPGDTGMDGAIGETGDKGVTGQMGVQGDPCPG